MREFGVPRSRLLLVGLLLALGACGKPRAPVAPKPLAPAELVDEKDLEFRYDADTQACRNAKGETGFNENRVVECGRVKGVKLEGYNHEGRNLRGLVLETSRLANSVFRGADLTGATFRRCDLSGSIFEGAQLARASFVAHPSNFILGPEAFAGARFDRFTFFSAGLVNYGELILKNPIAEAAGEKSSILVDDEVPAAEAALFRYDVARLGDLPRPVAKGDPRFVRRLFGELASAGDWQRFFAERTRRLVHDQKTRESPITIAVNLSPTAFAASNDQRLLDLEEILSDLRRSIGLVPAWLPRSIENLPLLRLGGEPVLYETPAAGVMALGQSYSARPILDRLQKLLHEARHADCPVAVDDEDRRFVEEFPAKIKALREDLLSLRPLAERESAHRAVESEIKRLEESLDTLESRLEQATKRLMGRQCNFAHVRCPMDHPTKAYRGLYACDRMAWGAYAVGAAFLTKMAKDCPTCPAETKAQAEIEAADQFDRLLNLESMMGSKAEKPPTAYWREPVKR